MNRDGEDGFLSRWSRRKSEVQRAEEKVAHDPVATPSGSAAATPLDEPFDVSTLPPIDSLTADSDLAAFMQKGVPSALRDAAISRMWVSDPGIRDYIGPSEMNWDFNAAEVFPGYGPLGADTDIAGMVTDIFEGPKTIQVAEQETIALAEAESVLSPSEQAAEKPEHASNDEEGGTAKPLAPPRRRHGSATPV